MIRRLLRRWLGIEALEAKLRPLAFGEAQLAQIELLKKALDERRFDEAKQSLTDEVEAFDQSWPVMWRHPVEAKPAKKKRRGK